MTSSRSTSFSARRSATRSARLMRERLLEPRERVPVALEPLARDARDADAVEHRHAPERLAGVDVGQMDLDGRQPGDLERVADRPRVVRPGARVEHQPVGVVARLVELLDVLALEVGLEEAHLEPELAGEAPDLLLEPREGQPAVVLGRPAVERVEVDAVHDGDAVPHDRSNSATAARRSSGATAHARAHVARAPRRARSRPGRRGASCRARWRRPRRRGRSPGPGASAARARPAAPRPPRAARAGRRA